MRLSNEKQLDLILRRMASDDSVDAPADALQYAKNLFLVREPEPSLLRRVLAVLQMDLAAGEPAFGERSTGNAKARQMLFNSDEHAIDLRIKPDGGAFSIHGQIVGEGFENGTATISGDHFETVIEIDIHSQFRFGNLVAGTYSLTFRGSETEIAINTLQI